MLHRVQHLQARTASLYPAAPVAPGRKNWLGTIQHRLLRIVD